MSAQVTIIGNLVADPEVKKTSTGKDVTTFSLAYSPVRPDGTKGEVSFFNITAWDYLGLNAAASFQKGDRLVVLARLRQDRWETEGGEKRNKLVLTADEIAGSVRFHTAQMTKVSGNTGSNGAGNADDDIFVS